VSVRKPNRARLSAEESFLRDSFARQAMLLFSLSEKDIEDINHRRIPNHELVAEFCYGLADAMLAQRLKH